MEIMMYKESWLRHEEACVPLSYKLECLMNVSFVTQQRYCQHNLMQLSTRRYSYTFFLVET